MTLDAETTDLTVPPDNGGPQVAEHETSLGEILALALGLVAIAVLLGFRNLWPAQFLLVVLVLVIPGAVLLRLFRSTTAQLACLSVPASLVMLLVAGLLTNFLGKALGLARPLDPVPVLVGVEIVSVLVLAAVAASLPPGSGWRMSGPRTSVPPSFLVPFLLPAVAAGGALRLNAGDGSTLAVVSAILCTVVLVIVLVRAERLTEAVVGSSLYSVGLALLWSFSLRSESVFGFDVTTEFRKMGETLGDGAWPIVHVDDAYGAMLSVTILPVQIHQLTGLSLAIVVKVIYPAIFAVAPVLIYAAARFFLRARWAFVAATVVIAQVNFAFQMPQLARQEISLVLFAALLVAMVDQKARRSHRYPLAVLFAICVVITHYSTTYFAIALFGVAFAALAIVAAVRRGTRERQGLMMVLVVVVVLVGGAGIWNGALTRSTANVNSILESFGTSGFQFLPNRQGEGLLEQYVTGTVTPQPPAAEYERDVVDFYGKQRTYVSPLPDASAPQYALADAPGPPPYVPTPLSLLGFALRQVVYGGGLLGAVLMLVRRRTSPAVRVLGALALASVVALAFVRLSGTIAESYNQDRALLQALFLLSPAFCWFLQAAAVRLRTLSAAARPVFPTLVGVGLVLQVALATSLLQFPLGRGDVNLTSNSENFARQYVRQGEVAGARWLGGRAGSTGLVYADRYGALRYLLATGRYDGVLTEIVPPVVDRNAWVFASATNVLDDSARSQTAGNFGIYRYPDLFLDENFDVVYSNGLSRVYHRPAR